jgi:hypothetical protein
MVDDAKRRNMLEDDFFSLAGFEKKKKKKKSLSQVQTTGSLPSGTEEGSQSIRTTTAIVESIDIKNSSDGAEPKLSSDIQNPESKLSSYVHSSDSDLELYSPLPIQIDRQAIRDAVAQRLSSSHDLSDSEHLSDSDLSDVDVEITSTVVVDDTKDSGVIRSSPSQYSFSADNERKRPYIIKVINKLPAPALSQPVDFGTKGMKSFTKILDAVIAHFRLLYQDNAAAQPCLDCYDTEKATLVWVEGRMEIKLFFKPSTLRIPPPQSVNLEQSGDTTEMQSTTVTCLLIPTLYAKCFLTLYPEFASSVPDFDFDSHNNTLIEDVSSEHSDHELIEESIESTAVAVEPSIAENHFTIGLKGKDNKRIEVKVSPATKIMSLFTHFCTVKGLDQCKINTKTLRLVFDDEDLDLNGVVGDTELEEDFEVQVVL